MDKTLLSVGLDVGTTTTQMVVSRLTVENKAAAFSVPRQEITGREILYCSPIRFTPLLDESRIDAPALGHWVEEEYRRAGITPEMVDTGAIIITGETSRKENARAVLEALSHMAGDFVVTTAGPDLESSLAAKGAGALALSQETGQTVLHMDIGGGTSNLALIREGNILRTGCLNVGGRLVRLNRDGRLTYVSPVLREIFPFRAGDTPGQAALEALAETLTSALEMAAGRIPATKLLTQLSTKEAQQWVVAEEPLLLSFSGGVADCIDAQPSDLDFGDLGPLLGRSIRKSLLCREGYRLGRHTIRATVIGAGCHSTQLSGSTVFCRNVSLPVRDLPVIPFREEESPRQLKSRILAWDTPVVLAMPGLAAPSYAQVRQLANVLADITGHYAYVCLEQDMAKALGQALAAILPKEAPILCLDGLSPQADSFLDIGESVGAAMPVVIKTLVL